MAYVEPRYDVLRRFPEFELHRYEPQLVAETEVRGSFDETGNEAFRILAAFISEENRPRQKVAMTAPVAQKPVSEKIEMTAPVTQVPAGGLGSSRWVFRFAMPARYTGGAGLASGACRQRADAKPLGPPPCAARRCRSIQLSP